MTLTNESITFTPEGIWIQPINSDRFRFSGSALELMSIMVYHHDLDIDSARFYVRNPANLSDLPAHGFGGHAVSGADSQE